MISAADNARIVRRFAAGWTLRRLKATEGASYNRLRRLLANVFGADDYRARCRANMGAGSRRSHRNQGHRLWTPAEDAVVRRDYRRRLARHIASELGRTVSQVRARARAMGMAIPQRIRAPGFVAFLRSCNAAGWSDAEIAETWGGTDRHAVSHLRRELGLPSNAHSRRVRRKIAAATARQCEREGVATLGALRTEIFRRRARAAGWPEDLRPRAVQILNALWQRGPMTRQELAEAIGMPWKGSRKSLVSNDPEGSYLAHLAKRGLVVNLGRIVKRPGSGHNVCMYSLPLGIERRVPDVQVHTA